MSTDQQSGEDLVEVVDLAPAAARRRAVLLGVLWFVHNSGRFDRPVDAWHRALVWLTGHGILITGTEAAGRTKAQFAAALDKLGWSYAHLAGAAVGECYAVWSDRLEQLSRPFARQLSEMTWKRSEEYGGEEAKPVHALVVHLGETRRRIGRPARRFWVVVVHMPLDNTALRAAAWADCCRGLVALKRDLQRRDPHAEVVIVMDGNKNLRDHGEAVTVHHHLAAPLHLKVSWNGRLPRRGGTHANQVIDFALAYAFAACQLLKDMPDSDHRAFRYRPRRSK